jgi:hypothetical protein
VYTFDHERKTYVCAEFASPWLFFLNYNFKENHQISKKRSVSRFQEKEKRGEMITKMITLNDNINDNTHAVQGKMITQK